MVISLSVVRCSPRQARERRTRRSPGSGLYRLTGCLHSGQTWGTSPLSDGLGDGNARPALGIRSYLRTFSHAPPGSAPPWTTVTPIDSAVAFARGSPGVATT